MGKDLARGFNSACSSVLTFGSWTGYSKPSFLISLSSLLMEERRAHPLDCFGCMCLMSPSRLGDLGQQLSHCFSSATNFLGDY